MPEKHLKMDSVFISYYLRQRTKNYQTPTAYWTPTTPVLFEEPVCQLILKINVITEAQINQVICLVWQSQQTRAINPTGLGTYAFWFSG